MCSVHRQSFTGWRSSCKTVLNILRTSAKDPVGICNGTSMSHTSTASESVMSRKTIALPSCPSLTSESHTVSFWSYATSCSSAALKNHLATTILHVLVYIYTTHSELKTHSITPSLQGERSSLSKEFSCTVCCSHVGVLLSGIGPLVMCGC